MLQGEHSTILSTFIKLPFVIKIFVLSIFEWPLKTGFTVVPLTLAILNNFMYDTTPAAFQLYTCIFNLENSVDPDQLASDEAS